MEYTVTIQESGERFACKEDESILMAMQRARTGPVQYGCHGGGCGVCKMRIVSGPYRIVKKMSRAHIKEADEESGVLLLCCVQPKGNIVLSRA